MSTTAASNQELQTHRKTRPCVETNILTHTRKDGCTENRENIHHGTALHYPSVHLLVHPSSTMSSFHSFLPAASSDLMYLQAHLSDCQGTFFHLLTCNRVFPSTTGSLLDHGSLDSASTVLCMCSSECDWIWHHSFSSDRSRQWIRNRFNLLNFFFPDNPQQRSRSDRQVIISVLSCSISSSQLAKVIPDISVSHTEIAATPYLSSSVHQLSQGPIHPLWNAA